MSVNIAKELKFICWSSPPVETLKVPYALAGNQGDTIRTNRENKFISISLMPGEHIIIHMHLLEAIIYVKGVCGRPGVSAVDGVLLRRCYWSMLSII